MRSLKDPRSWALEINILRFTFSASEVLGANFVVRFIAFRNILMIKQAIKVHVRVTRGCRLVLRENKRNSLNQWILLKEAASLPGCVRISSFATCDLAPQGVALLPNLRFANSSLFTAKLEAPDLPQAIVCPWGAILNVIKKSESAADVCMLGIVISLLMKERRSTLHSALNLFHF